MYIKLIQRNNILLLLFMNTLTLKVDIASPSCYDYSPPLPPAADASPPNNFYNICSHCNKNPCLEANAPRACGCETCGSYDCQDICPHDIDTEIRKRIFDDILKELMTIFHRYEE